MAISKNKKTEVVSEVSQLLNNSKLTVIVKYQGTSVKSMQELRLKAKLNGTKVKVVKNRLVKKALSGSDAFKDFDTSILSGQLMYAFNLSDEVAPAQVLAEFAKTEPQIEFVVGINKDGQVLSADDIKVLASLPSKDQLRAQLVGTIAAPISGFVNVMAGNIRGVINVLNAHADKIGN